jgi:hypothetical protein
VTGIDQTSADSPGEQNAIEISLRVWHPIEDPNIISQALALSPTICYRVGEPRKTPSGRVLSSKHRETLWSYNLEGNPYSSLAGALEAMDLLLDSRVAALDGLRHNGARLEYFVGLFVNADQTEVLSADLLSRCSRKGIEIIVSVYAPRGIGASP